MRREALRQLNTSGKIKDWHLVAENLPGRSNKDCRKRWFNEVTGGLKKGPWGKDEDARLRNGIQKYGYKWTVVAQEVGSRSGDQCAKRWNHSLNPALDRSEWSAIEVQTLIEATKTYGSHWKEIQKKFFPGRSANDVKNRFAFFNPPRQVIRKNCC